jgi:hypothetical protein
MGLAGCMQVSIICIWYLNYKVLGHLAVLAIALNWFVIHPIAIMVWIGTFTFA